MNKTKKDLSYISICSLSILYTQKIHFDGNVFGNKCCRCNEVSYLRMSCFAGRDSCDGSVWDWLFSVFLRKLLLSGVYDSCVSLIMTFEPRPAKSAFEHAQSITQAFALHLYILQYPLILFADSEGPDQTAQMCRVIWTFAVCIFPNTGFCIALLFNVSSEGDVQCLSTSDSHRLTVPCFAT